MAHPLPTALHLLLNHIIYSFHFIKVLKMSGNGRRSLSTEAIEGFKYLKIVEAKPFVYNVQMDREKKLNALNKQLWS